MTAYLLVAAVVAVGLAMGGVRWSLRGAAHGIVSRATAQRWVWRM
jgi:hypothetical protein